jgi:hypothetical protein
MSYLQDRLTEIPSSMAELYEPLSRLRDPNALSLRGVPKIPSGALSVEDAMMLKRMHRRHLLDPTGQPEIELQVLLKKTAAGLFSSPHLLRKCEKEGPVYQDRLGTHIWKR